MSSLYSVLPPLETKKNSIQDVYTITGCVLGVGINGKVVECIEKKTGKKFALKVDYIYYVPCQMFLSTGMW